MAGDVTTRTLGLDPACAIRPEGDLVFMELRGRRCALWPTSTGMAWLPGALSSPTSVESLARQAMSEGGIVAGATLHVSLDRLARLGALNVELRREGAVVATLRGAGGSALEPGPVRTGWLRLSRFSSIRREKDALVLDNPLAAGELHLRRATPTAWLLDDPIDPGNVPAESLPLLQLAADAGHLVPYEHVERTEHILWEAHDLQFHRRSRFGPPRMAGATYRFRGKMDPPPAIRPADTGSKIQLPPAAERLPASLSDVLAARRSWREPGPKPLSLAQLGLVLYHGARMLGLGRSVDEDVARYVYPSAGARYPLSIYVCAGECDGLEPGIYRHIPDEHALATVAPDGVDFRQLLSDARVGSAPPQVLLILAARFGRTTWKYEGIAYALVLKDAGVLLQTLHLAATAAGVGSCMVGSGDSDTFARATGIEPTIEAPVAEMVLGTLPTGSQP